MVLALVKSSIEFLQEFFALIGTFQINASTLRHFFVVIVGHPAFQEVEKMPIPLEGQLDEGHILFFVHWYIRHHMEGKSKGKREKW